VWLRSGGGATWAEWEIESVENISISSHTPKAATGALAGSKMLQATADRMPWQVAGGVRYAVDAMASDAAASAWPLHHAAGCSLFKVVTIYVTGTSNIGGTSVALADHGIQLYATYGASFVFRCAVRNGSGANICDTSSVATWAAGAKVLLEMHFDASGISVGVNGSPTGGAVGGAGPSANDASYAYKTMTRPDGAFGPADAIEHEQLIRIGRMDTATATKTRQALAAKHGIILGP
jgi:hypothetical protein